MSWGKGAVKNEGEDEAEPAAKKARAVPPRRRAAADDGAAEAPAAKKRAAAAEEAPAAAAPGEPLARALAAKPLAPVVVFTSLVEPAAVEARVAALAQQQGATLGEALHALYNTAGEFDKAAAFLRLSRGGRCVPRSPRLLFIG